MLREDGALKCFASTLLILINLRQGGPFSSVRTVSSLYFRKPVLKVRALLGVFQCTARCGQRRRAASHEAKICQDNFRHFSQSLHVAREKTKNVKKTLFDNVRVATCFWASFGCSELCESSSDPIPMRFLCHRESALFQENLGLTGPCMACS